MIKSVSYDQSEIIKGILQLHVPNYKIDCDPTFSKGVFYKNTGIDPPPYAYDIDPVDDRVRYGDCRNLPLRDSSLGCIMYDPPFLATTGKSLKSNTGNIISKRFGVYPSETSLHQFYIDSMIEFHRILK